MPTEPISGARFPDSDYAPNVPQDIENAVRDLAPLTITYHTSTTARDNTYTSAIANGLTWRRGLFAFVGTTLYTSGASTNTWTVVPTAYETRMMSASRTSDSGFNPTIGNTTWEAFTSGTNWVETDPHAMHGTGGTWNFPWTGWYKISAGAEFRENSTGERGLRINPIGFDMGRGSGLPQYLDLVDACAGTATIVSGTAPAFYATAGQTATLEGRQTSGSGLVIDHLWMDAVYLGPNT